MKKRGISLTALTIGVVILFILLSTISISVTYSINNAKKRTFAEEIYNIQKVVDEYIQKEGELPLTKAALQIQISDETQFAEETIVNKQVMLEELDLVELGIKNTVYGNKEDANDVYAISVKTGKVYYIDGFKSSDKTYYTLTDDLLKMVERNQDLQISEKSIVFTPSKVGWSKEGVSLVATVPSGYTNPSIQIDNENIVFNTTVQDGVTVYNVNQSKLKEKYTITIKYTKDGKEQTTSYTTKIDNTTPSITKDVNVSNTATHIKGVIATDEESGIKYFKYAEGAIDNDSNIKAYMSQYGKDVKKGSVKLGLIYTLYAEDKAGNKTVMYINKESNLTNQKPVQNKFPKIPEGFMLSIYDGEKTVEEGLVIYETNSLAGVDKETAMETYNQFVWVPVDDFSKFERTTTFNGTITVPANHYSEPYSELSLANDLTGEWAEHTAMKESVRKNGGFYIGRYETGTNVERTDGENGTTDALVQKNKPVYNYVGWGPSMISASGDVIFGGKNQGKGAVELSRNMYKDSTSVVSTLIYGVQWDSALQFISKKDPAYALNSTDKGNYTGDLANTGSSISCAINNIYDMAGSVWEWTMESFAHTSNSDDFRVFRGGSYHNSGTEDPASERSYYYTDGALLDNGFRIALYLK